MPSCWRVPALLLRHNNSSNFHIVADRCKARGMDRASSRAEPVPVAVVIFLSCSLPACLPSHAQSHRAAAPNLPRNHQAACAASCPATALPASRAAPARRTLPCLASFDLPAGRIERPHFTACLPHSRSSRAMPCNAEPSWVACPAEPLAEERRVWPRLSASSGPSGRRLLVLPSLISPCLIACALPRRACRAYLASSRRRRSCGRPRRLPSAAVASLISLRLIGRVDGGGCSRAADWMLKDEHGWIACARRCDVILNTSA